MQASPRHSHQSNGGAERAISTMRGLARVFLLHMVGKVGLPQLPANSAWWPWVSRHAAWTYNRFHRRRDGRAPYSGLRNNNYAQVVLPFG